MKRVLAVMVALATLTVSATAQAVVGPENLTRLLDAVHAPAPGGVWANTNDGTPPIYTVTPDSQVCRQDVIAEGPNAARLQPMWLRVPLPCDFQPAPGSDREAVVVNRTGDGGPDYYEFWSMVKDDQGRWHSYYGGSRRDAEFATFMGNRVWPDFGGVQASGYAFVPGIVTQADLAAGKIRHPVHLLVPYSCPTFHAPANRTDAVSAGAPANPGCIEYGTIFRFPKNFKINQLNLPPVPRMIAVAARDYGGLVVSDQTHSAVGVRFQGLGGGPDPYYSPGGYFGCDGLVNGSPVAPGGAEPDCWFTTYGIMARFPWEALRVVN